MKYTVSQTGESLVGTEQECTVSFLDDGSNNIVWKTILGCVMTNIVALYGVYSIKASYPNPAVCPFIDCCNRRLGREIRMKYAIFKTNKSTSRAYPKTPVTS